MKKCKAFLKDGVTPCNSSAKYSKEYCGNHLRIYEKKASINLVVEEEIKYIDDDSKNNGGTNFFKNPINPYPTLKIIEPQTKYETDQLEKILKLDREDPKNSNLLVIKYPELIKEWDFVKNETIIDISSISYSSHINVYWKCIKNKEHIKSFLSPNCRIKKETINGCKECKYDAIRVHDKNELNFIRENKNSKKNTSKIGDNTENFIVHLLIRTKLYKNVKKIGNIGGNGDIEITHFDDSINFIQSKTLTKNKEKTYYMTHDTKYPDDMLIIMVDKTRKYFALDFEKNINVKRLTLTFSSPISKYKDIMFTDIENFTSKLVELIPMSSTTNIINDNIKKEIFMLERLEKNCKAHNISFERNETNGNTIDGFINGKSFQAKYIKINSSNRATYNVTSGKSYGRIDGKKITGPYEIGDFDIMIIEIGGSIEESEKYINNFCIIPSYALIKENILKTNTVKGKKAFYICPPDYKKEHWSKQFWNNLEFLL